ncbi:MAG: peptide ABC transporter substrate-binding protein [Spirochaetia bacterium]|nr:peptide ABC transporter substrate-binding protein [Spirochaetia bacterium]MCF7946727.1 peptide ABC transporter substrate-binding protein [Spirochaetia bacterium]MCF7952903.1 peptide ABC transporter substrate-binding protein [Spirochaetales bacterium]
MNLMKKSLAIVFMFVICGSLAFANGQQDKAEVKEPKVLVFAMDYDPPSIDPQKNYAGFGEMIASNLHVGLVKTNERMEPEPAIAEDWDISQDGTEYTFYLRKDAKWSDGTPLTAEDFYYAWQRLLKPETNSKYVTMMFAVKNAEKVFKGEKDPEELGVEIIDNYTIKVELTGPLPYMLQNFAHGAFMPMKKEVISADPEGWAGNPETHIGNGPFALEKYSMNNRVILAKNPYYFEAEKVKLDELHFVTIPEGSTALAAYNSGKIDGFDYMPTSEIPRLMAETDEIYLNPRVRSLHCYVNNQKAPLDNPKVREALSRAIDRKELAKVMGLGRTPATGYVPLGLYTEGQDFRKAGGDLGISTGAEEERARAILTQAGYPGGEGLPKITVTMASGYRTTVETLQEMWKNVLNIEVEIQTVEGKVLAQKRRAGDFQIAMGGWSAQIFHPIYYLDQLYSTGGSNYPQYESTEYDALITEAKSEPDPKNVLATLHKAEDLAIGRDFALLPLYYETSRVMMKDYVKGWYTDPIGRFHFKYADIVK